MDEATTALTVVDVERRRWWHDDRILPPDTAGRAAELERVRVYVVNAFHEWGVTNFDGGAAVIDAQPDADGWRELPEAE